MKNINFISKIYNIDPWSITGLCDGDGSFWISISTSKSNNIGWSIVPCFSICAANLPANLTMLNTINTYWDNIGEIKLNKNKKTNYQSYELIIRGYSKCKKLQEHFDNYPLMTNKLVNYQLWSLILYYMDNKSHLEPKIFNLIIGIKALFKTGLSPALSKAFPTYPTMYLPPYIPQLNNINIDWIAGFINSDGHFGLFISKKTNSKNRTDLIISITQLNTSRIVLEHIVKFVGFGKVYPLPGTSINIKNSSVLNIASIKNIKKMINLLNKTKFYGVKELDFNIFSEAVIIIDKKEHLTVEDHNKLKAIATRLSDNRQSNILTSSQFLSNIGWNVE